MARRKSVIHKEIIDAMDRVRGPLAESRKAQYIMSYGKVQRKAFKESVPLLGELCDSAARVVPNKELATHAAWLYASKEGVKMPPDPSFVEIERLLIENGKELPFDENVALVRHHGPISTISKNAQQALDMIPEVERTVASEAKGVDYETLGRKGSVFSFMRKIYNAFMIVSAPIILAGATMASNPQFFNPKFDVGNNPLYGLGMKIALSGVGLLAAMFMARETHGFRCGSRAKDLQDALRNLKDALQEMRDHLEAVVEKTAYSN